MSDLAALFGEISAGLSQAFSGPYHAGEIPGVAVPGHYDDNEVWIPGTAGDPIPCMVQVDQATEAMRQADGYTDQDRRMLVLAQGVSSITTDDRISITEGPFVGTWMIASVARDPFAAYYELRGRRA